MTLTRLGGAPRRTLTAFAIPSRQSRSLQDRRVMTTSLRFHILSCFSILGGLSTVYGLTLAAQGASRYSVAALLTRPPRKTCSLRFRVGFALRLYHSNRAVAREYQKNIKAFAKISDNRVKFVAFSIRACYNSFRTWGYSSVGRALASHVRGQGFDSPYLHQDSKTAPNRCRFCLSWGDKGSAAPMTRFSRHQGARDCASTHSCLVIP